MKSHKRTLTAGETYLSHRNLLLAILLLFIACNTRASQAQSPPGGADPAVAAQMAQAVSLARHGDKGRALALANTLVQQHPRFAPGLKLQAMLLEDAGQGAKAAVSYEAALQLTPNDSELLLKVAIAKLVQGNPHQAIKLLAQRLKVLPRDEESLYYLAQAYHLNGDAELALKTIREALEVQPGDVSLWQKYGELLCSSGDNAEALRWLLKAQQSDNKLERINFDLAVASFNNMDLSNAVGYATRETELRPKNLDALALLASAQMKLALWAEAEANLIRIVAARSDDASFLLQLGHCELELKKYPAALDALNRSLQLDPTQTLPHFYLSRSLAALGRTAEARHEGDLHREMMSQISIALPKAEMQRESAISERARILLAQHQEQQALRLFEETPRDYPVTKGSPFVFVGEIYLSMGEADSALRNFTWALEADRKTRDASTYLGIIALQQADLARAEQSFDAELALDPNHPLAMAELGEVRYHQGRWADAAILIARSKTTIPSLLYMLCESYFHLGKTSNADLTAETLAAYGRKEPDVLQGLIDLLNRNSQQALAQRLSAELHR